MQAEVIGTLAGLQALREDWNALTQQSGTSNPYLSWEWCYHWWSVFGRGRAPYLVALRDEAGLAGLVSFMRHRKGWRGLRLRELRFADTGGMSPPYPDVVFRKQCEHACAAALIEHLHASSDWDRVCLAGIPITSPNLLPLMSAAAAAGLEVELQQEVWGRYISLPSTFDEYLSTLGPKTRAQVRRKRSRLLRRHQVEFGQCQTIADFEAVWPHFIALVRARWETQGKETVFARPHHVDFLTRFVTDLFARDVVRLWKLSLDGRVVAMLLGLVAGGDCYFWHHGYELEYTSDGIGITLIGYSIQEAIGEGARTFDFMRGEQEYKVHLARARRLCISLTLHSRSRRDALHSALTHAARLRG